MEIATSSSPKHFESRGKWLFNITTQPFQMAAFLCFGAGSKPPTFSSHRPSGSDAGGTIAMAVNRGTAVSS
jgi:hypothetical protein